MPTPLPRRPDQAAIILDQPAARAAPLPARDPELAQAVVRARIRAGTDQKRQQLREVGSPRLRRPGRCRRDQRRKEAGVLPGLPAFAVLRATSRAVGLPALGA